MALADWLDLKILQLLSRHTSGAVGALLSYICISRLVRWGVGPGTFSFYLEYIDKAVLFAIFLYFLLSVGYHLWGEVKHHARHIVFVAA